MLWRIRRKNNSRRQVTGTDEQDVASVQTAVICCELGVCSPSLAGCCKQGLCLTFQIKTENSDPANSGGCLKTEVQPQLWCGCGLGAFPWSFSSCWSCRRAEQGHSAHSGGEFYHEGSVERVCYVVVCTVQPETFRDEKNSWRVVVPVRINFKWKLKQANKVNCRLDRLGTNQTAWISPMLTKEERAKSPWSDLHFFTRSHPITRPCIPVLHQRVTRHPSTALMTGDSSHSAQGHLVDGKILSI